MSEAASNRIRPEQLKAKTDDIIEWQFVKDYGAFALQMNLLAAIALYEKARVDVEPSERKGLCLSGLQLLYSSLEDLSILLHAFRSRGGGRHLHLSLGVEEQGRQGSTNVPAIFKRYVSARQCLDDWGLKKVALKRVNKFFRFTAGEFEERYRTLTGGFARAGDFQAGVNFHKNKLKHGKPVIESFKGSDGPDDVFFLRWVSEKSVGEWSLEKIIVNASLEQFGDALTYMAQIYNRSLELLWLFMLNYWPQYHEDFLRNVMVPRSRECVERVEALGLSTTGLK
jgi:hypothetical protein